MSQLDAELRNTNGVLTPSGAATLLGMSRTHLDRILESGALAFHVVGHRDRSIAVADLSEYRDRMLTTQCAMIEDIVRSDEIDDLALNEFD